jgi:flagellar FliJ protein
MARKFTFNLQKYLDYKESIVNGKAADLLKSKKLLDKENNKLEKLFDEKEIAALDYKKNKPSRILDLAIMSSYVNQISKNIDDQKIVLDEKEKDFENEKISLQKDFKEKKAIDILKEKKLLKHKNYMKKNTEKKLDDLYMYRAKRNTQ